MNDQENYDNLLYLILSIVHLVAYGYLLYLGIKKKETRTGSYVLLSSIISGFIGAFFIMMHIGLFIADALLVISMILFPVGIVLIIKPFLSNKSKGQAA